MRSRPIRTRRRRPTRHRAPYQGQRFDWRNLPPLPVEERIEVPQTPSQTFLNWRDRCHRAAHLYLKHRGGAPSHELNRGTIFHATVERLTHQLIDAAQNRPPGSPAVRQPDPDTAKDTLLDVLKEHPELTVPASERDYLRMLVFHWAVGFSIDPDRVVGVEEMLALDVGRFTIRGKVDLITQSDFNMLDLDDYKTQRNMPGSDEWVRESYDDRGNPRWAGDFQTQVYATLAAFGKTREGLSVGENVDRFRVRLQFPSKLFEDGIGHRDAEISRLQLFDFLADLEGQLESLQHSIDTGKWQPTAGSHCGRCPAEYECPLPRHLRPESAAGEIETIEEAERLGVYWRFASRRNQALKARIKDAAQEHEWAEVRTGADTALTFTDYEREGFKTGALPKVREAVEGAVRYGYNLDDQGDLNLRPFVTTSQGTTFDERRVPKKGTT